MRITNSKRARNVAGLQAETLERRVRNTVKTSRQARQTPRMRNRNHCRKRNPFSAIPTDPRGYTERCGTERKRTAPFSDCLNFSIAEMFTTPILRLSCAFTKKKRERKLGETLIWFSPHRSCETHGTLYLVIYENASCCPSIY